MNMAAVPTLREKIGQLLLVGFRGAVPAECEVIVRDIREHHIGSVILFDQDMAGPLRQGSGGQGGTIDSGPRHRNIVSPDQVRALLGSPSEIQSETMESGARREKWIYSSVGKTVIFENGVVVSVQ